MSRRNKLEKFVELLMLENVYESPDFHNPGLIGLNGEPVDLKGNWAKGHFHNSNPIVLELACGRGEYSNALAELFPEKNFIGVDIKGARIHKGAKKALAAKLMNVAFLRTKIELLEHYFSPDEVSEIWITFPDPFLKESKSNKRLTSENFIKKYRSILASDGIVHLKTDDDKLYAFTLSLLKDQKGIEIIYAYDDIYSLENIPDVLKIKTHYELQHLGDGKTIKYIQFKFLKL